MLYMQYNLSIIMTCIFRVSLYSHVCKLISISGVHEKVLLTGRVCNCKVSQKKREIVFDKFVKEQKTEIIFLHLCFVLLL